MSAQSKKLFPNRIIVDSSSKERSDEDIIWFHPVNQNKSKYPYHGMKNCRSNATLLIIYAKMLFYHSA